MSVTDSQLPSGIVLPSARSGTLFIISGPSGAGKGTLVSRVLARLENLQVSISATTRAPRNGEQDGREYFFLTNQQFSQLAEQDGFLEWAEVHGKRYGTPRKEAQKLLASGCDLILEIDVQGCEQILSRMPEAVSIFVAPPSLEVLERRLRNRASDDQAAILGRLRVARLEMKKANSYNHLIVNNQLEQAVNELESIIVSYR